jgi:hypothetical protein
MYATAAARADGLLLLCGGRDASGTPLGDAFGLARHRDGRWEWAAAPGVLSLLRAGVVYNLEKLMYIAMPCILTPEAMIWSQAWVPTTAVPDYLHRQYASRPVPAWGRVCRPQTAYLWGCGRWRADGG